VEPVAPEAFEGIRGFTDEDGEYRGIRAGGEHGHPALGGILAYRNLLAAASFREDAQNPAFGEKAERSAQGGAVPLPAVHGNDPMK
jgi:hypothetical protein